MKIILSRKGFDSSSGGCPNPILPDNTLLSLPIPDDTQLTLLASEMVVTFNDLRYGDYTYSQILKGIKPKKEFNVCHLDPDLREGVRIKPVENWKPAFGQTGSALGVLRKAKVTIGDLFLFFGVFRKTEYHADTVGFIKAEKPVQIVYGYLQIGAILERPDEIAEYYWHPHAVGTHYKQNSNALYLPSDSLSLYPALPGYGVLSYRADRVLTKPNENAATWKEHSFLMPECVIGNRKNSAKGSGVYYAGQWQELVLKENNEATKWALGLIT